MEVRVTGHNFEGKMFKKKIPLKSVSQFKANMA
jgi:hypothetical protein